MAAIENASTGKHATGRRLNKKIIKVDLTPMVDLGFLLITFFVFTTTMAKATVMKVEMPFDQTTIKDPVCNSCVLTTILGKDDVIHYYEGAPETAVIKATNYAGIREIIMQKKKKVKEATGNEDRFVLIIKPTAECSFKNFVDIRDEVTINLIKLYYIDEVTEEEKKKLAIELSAKPL